jgi:fructose-1,6-bisphosphatase/inositol monophosphatase family enzyme
MSKGVHSVRIMGSGVLDLCYVACGRLDAVYAGVAGNGISSLFTLDARASQYLLSLASCL